MLHRAEGRYMVPALTAFARQGGILGKRASTGGGIPQWIAAFSTMCRTT